MNPFLLFNGFLLGVIGSLHCMGMCGPLVLSLPMKEQSWHLSLLENIARAFSYSCLGFLAGLMGKALLFHQYQLQACLTLGLIILVFMLMPRHFQQNIQTRLGLSWLNRKLMKLWVPFLKRREAGAMASIGLLHGLLPCGLVMLALASASTIHEPLQSALFMFFFGLGTIPALLTTVLMKKKFQSFFHIQGKTLVRLSIFFFAGLMILRGLALDIPYLSPGIEEQTLSCCGTKG